MDIIVFLKSVFRRTNKNWKLLIVQFVTYLIMIPILAIGVIVPALIIVIPIATNHYEVEDFAPYIFSNIVIVLFGVLIFLIFLLIVLLLWAFVAGGIRATVVENILKGKVFEMKTFMENCRKFFARLIGLWSLFGLIYTGIFVIFGGFAAAIFFFCYRLYQSSQAAAITTGIAGGGILLLIYVVIAILFAVYSIIANTYLIVEDAQVGESMRGGMAFIKKYPGHTFLVFLILLAIGLGVGMAYAIVTMPIRIIPYVGAMASLVLSPIQMALNLYLSLFGIVAYTLFYLVKTKRTDYIPGSSTVPEKTI